MLLISSISGQLAENGYGVRTVCLAVAVEISGIIMEVGNIVSRQISQNGYGITAVRFSVVVGIAE